MELSAELFVLDNLLMDLLMLRLAAAIGALRLRPVAAVLAAFLGAVYALLSMSALPQLTAPVPKLLLCAAASLPLVSAPRDLPRALLSLLAAACLTGGLMMALCLLLGGSLSGGALIGTVPLRVALLGAATAALLPRPVRAFFSAVRGRSRRVRLRTRVMPRQCYYGRLDIDVLDGRGACVFRIMFMNDWTIRVKQGNGIVPVSLYGGGWFDIEMDVDCYQKTVGFSINGSPKREFYFFNNASTVERICFRTGEKRRGPYLDEEVEYQPPRDLPGAGEMLKQEAVFYIDSFDSEPL